MDIFKFVFYLQVSGQFNNKKIIYIFIFENQIKDIYILDEGFQVFFYLVLYEK